MEDIESGRLFKSMSRDLAIFCVVFLGLKVRIDDEAKESDMCKVVRDITQAILCVFVIAFF